ncbi:DNA polymerase-1 [Rhizobium ruizarguesonis]
MKTLIIDGDALVYQLAFSAEVKTNWADEGEEPVITIHADEAETTFRLLKAVDALQQLHWADTVVFALSDPDANFRLDFWPTYKGNRKDSRKPILHERMREVVQERFKTYLKPRLEADDTIGILATSQRVMPGEKIIISDDKDFNTIPAIRFKFRKNKDGELLHWDQSQLAAEAYHLQQTISGDMTDFYPGCPGQGPIKAEKHVAGLLSGWLHDVAVDGIKADFVPYVWPKVVAKYEAAGLTEEHALTQARCARILRASDFNFKTQEPILWTPN